jgi:hypothetical protein
VCAQEYLMRISTNKVLYFFFLACGQDCLGLRMVLILARLPRRGEDRALVRLGIQWIGLHKGIASSRRIDFPKNCAELATSTCTPKEQQQQELDEPPN